MKKIFIIVCFSFLLSSYSDNNSAQIKSGEKLVYAGSYNMSGLMTQIAQVTMSTENVTTSKNNYLHLSCELSTYTKWDSFFKIRDIYESYVNPATLKPSLYKRSIDEGGYTKKEKYTFKGNNVKSTVNKKNQPESQKTFTIGANTQDVISLLYKVRTIDFSKFKAGQTQSMMIVFDETEIPVTLKFMGKETVNAGNLGKKECYKISIGAKTDALRGKDKNLIWLTADAKKIPAFLQFSIPVGTGQLALTSATGI
ncbi:DUF3108 domain-containing protein [Flavobacterium capsici]|uniref:DUF3108 domain-containing protein n=1 Tax=Flavobacterium capsici TaxID=3075618 RepID=A0AA96EZN2_9FLAO|nr:MULTISPECIES: DUF3108 domain-containing protein [unclassified Flavobacterium]WNM19885.1 DUF3108 domain-containing protein [Flavobacterium sp. PMR2A8]WNM21274.1 DUF3108 domain-containing protein [Flavobacterium sp. PMTSA4]